MVADTQGRTEVRCKENGHGIMTIEPWIGQVLRESASVGSRVRLFGYRLNDADSCVDAPDSAPFATYLRSTTIYLLLNVLRNVRRSSVFRRDVTLISNLK